VVNRSLLACLATVCIASDNGVTWFIARDEMLSKSSGALERGVIAAGFNDLEQAERDLLPLAASSREARDYLTAAYSRNGLVQKALALNGRSPFFQELSKYPELSVSHRSYAEVPASRDQRGRLLVLVSAAGVEARYHVDTGSGKSLMSLSEAMRLGVKVESVATTVMDLGGGKSEGHLAIVPSLSVGDMRLRNVPFFVIADGMLGVPGVLGIDVLLALQTVRWKPAGTFEVGFPSRGKDVRRSNLYFDGATPITEVRSGDRRMTFVVDTGKDTTDLFPRFGGSGGRGAVFELYGFAGRSRVKGMIVPEVKLEFGGYETTLRPARVLTEKPPLWSEWHHGILGMDVLSQARAVTMDFVAMRLLVE